MRGRCERQPNTGGDGNSIKQGGRNRDERS